MRVPDDASLNALSSVAPGSSAQEGGAEYLGTGASRMRFTWLMVVFGAGLLFVFVRAVELQTVRSDAYRTAAERNRLRTTIIVPERGAMTDRRGVVLARGERVYAIGIAPADFPPGTRGMQIAARIAEANGGDAAAVTRMVASFPAALREPVAVSADLTYADAIRAYVALRDVPAAQIMVGERRTYRDRSGAELDGASHLLGYVARVSATAYPALARERYRPSDFIGTAGVEAAYERALRGMPGLQSTAIDARGLPTASVATEPAVAGSTLTLTLDRAVHTAAARALRAALTSSGARRGSVIALDPVNGELLAFVTLPEYSPTALARGLSATEYAALEGNPNRPLFPRTLAGLYPSGSTIKPFVAAAALAEGVITPKTRIVSTGGIRVGTSWFPDWRAGGHGLVTVREALAQSVNTFFYMIGGGYGDVTEPLGPDRIADALRAFGFGSPTGIDLAGEANGIVPTAAWKQELRGEPWYIGDTYHLAIGQGDLLITPLQLARATAALANGGTLVTPHVVLGATDAGGVFTVMQQTPPVSTRFMDASVLDPVISGMRAAVTEGSARQLADLPFWVAGKTGTAQTTSTRPPHAWFTGFARVNDRQLVVTVLVEEGGEGSAVAVPVARATFASWAASPAL